MEGKMNLWQRCEALGPMEDQGVQIHKWPERDYYSLCIDGQQVFFIHEDGTINDICRAWLADAILQRFEAITMKDVGADKETVHSFSGGPKEWRERFMADETDGRHNEPNWEGCPPGSVPVAIPQPMNPTQEQLYALLRYIHPDNGGIGVSMIGGGYGVHYNNEPNNIAFWIQIRVVKGGDNILEFHSLDSQDFETACDMVGFMPALPTPESLPEPTYIVEAPKPTEPTQEQLKALVQYIRSVRTFLKSQKIEVTELEETTGDTGLRLRSIKPPMLAVIEESSPSLINFRCNIPFDDFCQLIGYKAKQSEVTESNQQFVSIPVTEWEEIKQSLRKLTLHLGINIENLAEDGRCSFSPQNTQP